MEDADLSADSTNYSTAEQCLEVVSSCLDQTLKHEHDVLCDLTEERERPWVQAEDEPMHFCAEKWLQRTDG